MFMFCGRKVKIINGCGVFMSYYFNYVLFVVYVEGGFDFVYGLVIFVYLEICLYCCDLVYEIEVEFGELFN